MQIKELCNKVTESLPAIAPSLTDRVAVVSFFAGILTSSGDSSIPLRNPLSENTSFSGLPDLSPVSTLPFSLLLLPKIRGP